MGTATDVAFMLAQSQIQRPGTSAAVAKGAALLHELRQAAGLTLDDLGRALEVDDPSLMGPVEKGKVGHRRRQRSFIPCPGRAASSVCLAS